MSSKDFAGDYRFQTAIQPEQPRGNFFGSIFFLNHYQQERYQQASNAIHYDNSILPEPTKLMIETGKEFPNISMGQAELKDRVIDIEPLEQLLIARVSGALDNTRTKLSFSDNNSPKSFEPRNIYSRTPSSNRRNEPTEDNCTVQEVYFGTLPVSKSHSYSGYEFSILIPADAPENLFPQSYNDGMRKKAGPGEFTSFTCNPRVLFSIPEVRALAIQVLSDIPADEIIKAQVRQKFRLD